MVSRDRRTLGDYLEQGNVVGRHFIITSKNHRFPNANILYYYEVRDVAFKDGEICLKIFYEPFRGKEGLTDFIKREEIISMINNEEVTSEEMKWWKERSIYDIRSI